MTYLILSIITILLFVFFGTHVKRCKVSRYYLAAIIPVLMYCITYGCREGWAIDYIVYEKIYNSTRAFGLDSYEPFFKGIIYLFWNLDLSYPFFLSFVSLLIISAVLFILNNKREIIVFAIPIFYLLTAYQAANLIRYFMAISLLYVAIELLLRNKYYHFIVACILAIGIHYSVAILIPSIFLFYRFNILINWKLNLFLFGISFFFLNITENANTSMSSSIYGLLKVIDFGNSQLSKYIDSSVINDYIIGSREESIISIFNVIFRWGFAISYFFLGAKLFDENLQLKKGTKSDIKLYYQLSVFGIILMNITLGTEILTRIMLFYYILLYIPVSYILLNYNLIKGYVLLKVILIISLVYICVTPIKGLYTIFNNLDYIWD